VSTVETTVEIAAPPADVWRVVMDPQRLGEWVTIHRKLHDADPWPPHEGARMDQTLALRGAPFKVRWTLVACEDTRRAVWQGKGPAHSRAETEYELSPTADGGTSFHYRNTFKAPLGPLGAVASRAVVGGLPVREAEASLARLRTLCETPR
jgi:uncharacterized protein YndB with AHSA1/START domain